MTVEGDIATIGITEHAQELLGDVVFVDMPEVGAAFEQHETMGAVESVKAASDIYSPVSGVLSVDLLVSRMCFWQPDTLTPAPHVIGPERLALSLAVPPCTRLMSFVPGHGLDANLSVGVW